MAAVRSGRVAFLLMDLLFVNAITTNSFLTFKVCFDVEQLRYWLKPWQYCSLPKNYSERSKYHFISLGYPLFQLKENHFKTHENRSVRSRTPFTCRLLIIRELQRRSYHNIKCASETWITNIRKELSPGTMYLPIWCSQETTLPSINC